MHLYSAENHDWDLTLRAAWCLLMTGQAVEHLPTPGNKNEKEYSCFTGSMLLSFCAIESFSASVAFSMPKTERFKDFNFDEYRRKRNFWDKLELIWSIIPYEIKKGEGLFQTVGEMQTWRNLVTHASPYEIDKTLVEDTIRAPGELHKPFHVKEYARHVNLENAKKFYLSAVDYIELLKEKTDLDPRATATYVARGNTEEEF